MCVYCKGNMKEGKTVFTVQYGENIIVIKNVPCMECEQCGEREISDNVMIKLEKIVETAKKLVQEIAVIDYNAAAA